MSWFLVSGVQGSRALGVGCWIIRLRGLAFDLGFEVKVPRLQAL